MKIKILQIFLFLSLLACKEESYTNDDFELIKTVQNKIKNELKPEENLVFIKLVKKDTLTVAQESDALLRYSNFNLIRLNKMQKFLIKELKQAQNMNDLEVNKLKYERLNDSINYYTKIGANANTKLSNVSASKNYRVVFLRGIRNRKTDSTKEDSLLIYINEKNVIFTEAQFLKLSIARFE